MYNQNYYYNIPRSNFTFRNAQPHLVPPPPPPPAYFIPPTSQVFAAPNTNLDKEFVKEFEKNLLPITKPRKESISINDVKNKLCTLVTTINDIKCKESKLRLNKVTLSDKEWKSTMEDIEKEKAVILKSMAQINDTYLETLQKALAKRATKRMRLKRIRSERRREREELKKYWEERSRKIDENLQKIKDDIDRVKQEEEAKLQADVVLKEVLRKKHDAKKCIVKLEALLKLRKARENTAKGRGENVSERDATTFNNNIEKLKYLWVTKLSTYDTEEAGLRAKLKIDTADIESNLQKKEREVAQNLSEWQEFLFGDMGQLPQLDFHGDVETFVVVRSKWDQFISNEGSALPVGWVAPNIN